MKIQFLKDTSTAKVEVGGSCLLVYRDGYKLPKVNCEVVEFEKYKVSYTSYTVDNIVMVGLNRIFVPANRCEMVYEYLQTMTSNINKISIDTAPFVGEPWRLWFHYSFVYGTWLGLNYSYAVETDWQHWFYREAESSIISAESIVDKKMEVYSDLEKLKSEFEFYTPNAMLLEYYEEVKKVAFEKYGTPKQIIQFMLKQLNNHLSIDFNFDSYSQNKKWLLPNFGVYSFVSEECKRRINIYNSII